jgi:hypothetical protein
MTARPRGLLAERCTVCGGQVWETWQQVGREMVSTAECLACGRSPDPPAALTCARRQDNGRPCGGSVTTNGCAKCRAWWARQAVREAREGRQRGQATRRAQTGKTKGA